MNKNPVFTRQPKRSERGLSLVELMIAMAIGLLLLSAIGYIYLANRQTFRTLEDFSRVQENYRYALDQLGNEIRMAGYAGCAIVASQQQPGSPLTPVAHHLAQAVGAFANQAGWPAPALYKLPAAGKPPSDVLYVTLAQSPAAPLTGLTGGSVPVSGNPAGLKAGDLALVSDCMTANVITVAAAGANSITPAAPLAKVYTNTAQVYPLLDRYYFIGLNAANNPSLYRLENRPGAQPEELIENVEAMELRFGVDNNGDAVIDAYQNLAGVVNWQQVMSVRVSLVFVSNQNTATDVQSYTVEGVNYTPADNRMRQVATVTYGLRNRLP
jgi:type IV pilus assembly protein PilW